MIMNIRLYIVNMYSEKNNFGAFIDGNLKIVCGGWCEWQIEGAFLSASNAVLILKYI